MNLIEPLIQAAVALAGGDPERLDEIIEILEAHLARLCDGERARLKEAR